MQLPVAVLPPPTNATFSPPLQVEAHLLGAVGHFRIGGGAPAADPIAPQLLPPLTLEEGAAASSLRALLCLSRGGIDLHFAGRAAPIRRALRLASGALTSRVHWACIDTRLDPRWRQFTPQRNSFSPSYS